MTAADAESDIIFEVSTTERDLHWAFSAGSAPCRMHDFWGTTQNGGGLFFGRRDRNLNSKKFMRRHSTTFLVFIASFLLVSLPYGSVSRIVSVQRVEFPESVDLAWCLPLLALKSKEHKPLKIQVCRHAALASVQMSHDSRNIAISGGKGSPVRTERK